MRHGSLADAVLGERRVSQCIEKRLRSVTRKRLKPVTRMLIGLGLTFAGLIALGVLAYAPDRFAAATPIMADLEDWLIWRDLQAY
ncbi:MAG: hypothetical protein GKS02_05625 [Alphaproteobacteria bacterium]|nr:hypothetical protein [Alphaproteobacteria bacterium]